MRKKRILTALLLCIIAASPALASKKPKPDFEPLKGEYYPVEGKAYPQAMTNPYAQPRTVGFTGAPLEVYTQINMVTWIQLPAPPIYAAIGHKEAFVVEVIPELHMISVKPTQEVNMTNLNVKTERGTYLFILKENPYKPWDTYMVITDPYRNVQVTDSNTLIIMAYKGVRPAEYQFAPVEMRSPETTAHFYDPVTKMGSKATLKRAVSLPKENKQVYWIEISNIIPPDIIGEAAAYAVDERSIWTQGVEKVAVPGTQTDALPLLARGDKVDMFLIVNGNSIPSMLNVRMMLSGSRSIPVEIGLPTQATKRASRATASSLEQQNIPAEETVDEQLTRMYQEMMKKKTESAAPSAPVSGQSSTPSGQGGAAQEPNTIYIPKP